MLALLPLTDEGPAASDLVSHAERLLSSDESTLDDGLQDTQVHRESVTYFF